MKFGAFLSDDTWGTGCLQDCYLCGAVAWRAIVFPCQCFCIRWCCLFLQACNSAFRADQPTAVLSDGTEKKVAKPPKTNPQHCFWNYLTRSTHWVASCMSAQSWHRCDKRSSPTPTSSRLLLSATVILDLRPLGLQIASRVKSWTLSRARLNFVNRTFTVKTPTSAQIDPLESHPSFPVQITKITNFIPIFEISVVS